MVNQSKSTPEKSVLKLSGSLAVMVAGVQFVRRLGSRSLERRLGSLDMRLSARWMIRVY